MEKWEYAEIEYGASMGSSAYVHFFKEGKPQVIKGFDLKDPYKALEALNALGNEGWELVSSVILNGLNHYKLFLKRKK